MKLQSYRLTLQPYKVVATEPTICLTNEATILQVDATTLQVVAIAVTILALAVLIEDELEEEHVEDDDEEGDGDPEESGQASKVMAMFVQCQHMMFVGGGCTPNNTQDENNFGLQFFCVYLFKPAGLRFFFEISFPWITSCSG